MSETIKERVFYLRIAVRGFFPDAGGCPSTPNELIEGICEGLPEAWFDPYDGADWCWRDRRDRCDWRHRSYGNDWSYW